MFLHEARQIFHILDGSLRQNAVAKIKDVAGASGGAAQNIFRSRLQLFPVGEQQHRIEIALHGATMVEALPAFVERNAPVESDDVRARFFHGGQQRGAVGAEINDGRSRLLQLLHHAGDMRQDVAAIIFHAQASDPTVENLNHIGPGPHLFRRIFRRDSDQLAISSSHSAGELYIIFLA